MSKHEELIERLEALAEEAHAYHDGSEFAIKAKANFREAIEAQAREIEGLRKDAERAKQLEQLARYMFEADNDYGAGFSGDPNWRLWYTRLADLVGVKLESTP